MCGWTGNSSPAARPARSTMRAIPAGENGAHRAEVKTKGDSGLSRTEATQGASRDRIEGNSRRAILGPTYAEGRGLERDLIRAEIAELSRPQAASECQEDHRRIAVAVTIALGRLDQLLDLREGEVFPRPQFPVQPAPWSNCSKNGHFFSNCALPALLP
jgi:hypothetical protein